VSGTPLFAYLVHVCWL